MTGSHVVGSPYNPPIPSGVGKLVYADNTGCPIRLFRNARKHVEDRYTVQYGLQVRENLSYGEACDELGQAIMHTLCSEGKMDSDDTDG